MAKYMRSPKRQAVIRQLLPIKAVRTNDQLLQDIHTTLPAAKLKELKKMYKKGVPRSQIAKQLGISKVQLNTIIIDMKKDGGAA